MISRKQALTASFAAALISASSAYAHTTIQTNSLTASASTLATSTTYNNVVIGHGCTDAKGKKWPIKHQSVVFPTVSPVLIEASNPSTPSNLTLADIITSTTGLANIPQLIQNNDVFSSQSEKTDANGNVIGFNGFKGELNTNLHGLIPFRTGAITFKTGATASNSQCIQKLVIKIGIADICKTTFPPKEGTANLWIPNQTSKFSTPLDGMCPEVNGVPACGTRLGSPATLTINNGACPTGETVTVWPSDDDIDANLPMKGWGKK